jgi:mannose-6-phosphate isomerase-like protein (cupin superfamily)
MTKIQPFKPFTGEPPIPKPSEPVKAHVVTVQDGMPVKYGDCEGIGVRVVHPSCPKAYTTAMGIVAFFLPPHAQLPVGSHYTEECYIIVKGQGTMTLAQGKVEVKAGTFIHMPPWAEHGIENTGLETMEILICTVPPNA